MAIREEQRERVLEALMAHLLGTGLSQTSLRQLAAAAGVSDRMLLYYFADKAEVMTEVMRRLAFDMAQWLSLAVPEGAAMKPAALMALAGRFVLDQDFLPYMRLWLEVIGAAARDEAPFGDIAKQVTQAFLDWIEHRIDAPSGPAREGMAAMILALVDGLVLVEVGAGHDQARQAVETLEALAELG